jgi:hypothetical protein
MNPLRRRFAVLTERGEYTTFLLLESIELQDGEDIWGDFESTGAETYSFEERGLFTVYAESVHCSAHDAASWVAGTRVA